MNFVVFFILFRSRVYWADVWRVNWGARTVPANTAFLSLPRFWRTREGLCMNRVLSSLSMCCILLWYSFEPRPNSCALVTAGSDVTIGLSISRSSQTKKKNSLTRENTIDSSRSLGCGDLKGLTWFRQSWRVAFSPLEKTKGGQKEALYSLYLFWLVCGFPP